MKNRYSVRQMLGNCFRLMIRQALPVMFIFFLSSKKVFAQPVNIIFNPSVSTVQVDQIFTIDVVADFTAAGTLNVFETYINFNPLDLEVQSTPTVPPSTASALPSVSVDFETVGDMNLNGRIDYGRFRSSPTGHPNSDFVFMTITFKALRVPPGGNTALVFNTTIPRQTIALEGAAVVSNQIINGSLTINPAGCTTPPTATIANTGTCNGQPFDLILSNATGATDWNLIINGTPYNDISVGETILTVTPPTQSIWPASAPTSTLENDGTAVEVGIKFRSDVIGLVKGIRFFRPSTAGTYTGRLYLKTGATSGTQMAVVTFPAAPANQWQEALFTAPVQINANTTYVVTYHSTSGDYRTTSNYFTSSGVTNGHLTALAEGVDGSNGIYGYFLSGGTYPPSSFASSNYWVDPLFVARDYTYTLTSVTDNDGCLNTGSPLQTLTVSSPACSPLPVTLLNLSATPQGKNVILNWTTSSEINNKGFEIQRSGDNVLWEGLGFVNGAGTSSIPHSYTYTDNSPFPQRYYYRLKQVDNDNNYKFSMTVTVLLSGKGEYSLKQNYPNPFATETSIQYTLPETQKVKLTVFDVNGRTVKVLVNETRQAGTHAINFYTNKLQPGLYYYKLEAGSFSTVKKMIVQ